MTNVGGGVDIAIDQVGPRLELAAELLASGEGVVVLEHRLVLSRERDGIRCAVVTRLPEHARASDAVDREIEAGKQLLEESTLIDELDSPLLDWIVIDDYGKGAVRIWPKG